MRWRLPAIGLVAAGVIAALHPGAASARPGAPRTPVTVQGDSLTCSRSRS